MKIGIFGGSFNPPHKMHKKIALELINKKYIDYLIYVPTGNLYPKQNLVNDKIRYKMLELMIKGNNNLEVSDYEFGKLTYTYQTLKYFKTKYPNDEIYFICGSDNLKQIESWKNYQEILNNYKILIIKRNDDINDLIDKYKNNILVTDIEEDKLSSTMIRKNIKERKIEEIKDYIDREILNYILENGLYH